MNKDINEIKHVLEIIVSNVGIPSMFANFKMLSGASMHNSVFPSTVF